MIWIRWRVAAGATAGALLLGSAATAPRIQVTDPAAVLRRETSFGYTALSKAQAYEGRSQ
jgi:hypothetical protein